MWSDLQADVVEEFAEAQRVHVAWMGMTGFRLIGDPQTKERIVEKKASAVRVLRTERASLKCTVCGAMLSPPMKRGRRPTTCGAKCRLKRLYALRRKP